MSLREKTAWCCLVSTVAVHAGYFTAAASLLTQGRLRAWPLLLAMMAAAIVQGVGIVLGFLLFAWRNLGERQDERDAALKLRASRNAGWTLAAGGYPLVIAVPVASVSGAALSRHFVSTPLLLSQAVLFCFVLAETVRCGTLAWGCRRGH